MFVIRICECSKRGGVEERDLLPEGDTPRPEEIEGGDAGVEEGGRGRGGFEGKRHRGRRGGFMPYFMGNSVQWDGRDPKILSRHAFFLSF